VPGVPTELKSATIAPRTTVEYAQIILKTPLRISNELLNMTSDTFPRTTVEYAQIILKNTLGMSEKLLNTTRSVAPRVIAEYSSKTAKMPLVFPKELLNDTTAPIIADVTITRITDNSATIKWDTCEMADSLVKYCKVSGIYTQSKSNPLFITNHTITLEGLSPGTTYYFVVNSTDRSDTYLPGEPIANQTIIFDASNSTDTDGTITNYEWDFGDATTGFGKVTTHSYAENGTYNVTLTVTDNDDATDMRTKESTIGDAEDPSGTPDQSSFRLYQSTVDDEIHIEIYGPFEPGLNTKVNYEVLITPTNQAGGPIHSGKVYFAYPDNNTNIHPIELRFKTCVDHNWYRIDMAEDFSRDEWINWGVDTLMSMGTGIPGLWGIAKMLLGPSYPTPPEGTAYFDENNTQILSEPICHHTRDIVIYINAGR
jgi:PKD repeat protein